MNQKTKSIGAVILVLLFVIVVAVAKETKDFSEEQKVVYEQTYGKPKMIECGSDICVPCKMMDEVLEELREEYSNTLEIEFVHAKNKEFVKEYGINAIPTQIFFNEKGKEIFRHSGFFSTQEIINKFLEMGITLEKNK
ncbi:MAG: thioredoxin family protein [Caldisericia bacterium]|nr:thioredoxin family protein [Caldisericia bacterium]